MRKKVSKLFLGLALLTVGVSGVLSPAKASASFCEPYCLDPDCNCVINCWYAAGQCICDQFCSQN
jgi:hypothetical protein